MIVRVLDRGSCFIMGEIEAKLHLQLLPLL
jgi:hypothetical protein